MRFSPPDDDVVLYKEGFKDDILDRAPFGAHLSEVLERTEDPLVVALDGRWGTGKSYFLKRWVGAHNLENDGTALTVYFDAFQHDYLDDPLIALIATLSAASQPSDESAIDKVKGAAIKLLKPAMRMGLAVATKGGSLLVGELGETLVEAAGGEADRAMQAFWQREEGRHHAMKEFREALKKLTEAEDEGAPRPLIIVVDELDRCRPDFALEVLEIAKHFFAVPHVHFVLGANLAALENSVKTRYGHEIDASAYLRKFISFVVSLPDHTEKGNKIPATQYYLARVGEQMGVPRHLIESIQQQMDLLSRTNHISLREAGKIMSYAALLPEGALNERNPAGYATIMVSLIITRVINPNVFDEMVKGRFEYGKMRNYFGIKNDEVQLHLVNGEGRNPGFNYFAAYLDAMWSYAILGDKYKNKEFQDMDRYFRNYYGNPAGVPQQIFDMWLSRFRIV